MVTIPEDVKAVVGVDTHVDSHTAAVCDQQGRYLAELTVPTTRAGYSSLLAWAIETVGSTKMAWAVEGTRHYGLGLVRFLQDNDQMVSEIDQARHLGKRRGGKSDPIDAVRAAKELLARPAPSEVRADGDREALRLLMVDRDNAVGSRRTARTALTSVIVTAPAALRDQVRHLSREKRARVCAGLMAPEGASREIRVAHQTLARLGQRVLDLGKVIDALEVEIAEIVDELAPGLVCSEPGMGALSGAQLLLSWSHAGRVRTESGFGMLSGTAPVPASTGRTDRHRLNRLGDRQLNRALHVIATNRMRHHGPTRAYVGRRRAEGKTDKEIRRCIKRYLARHLYRTLNRLDTT